MIPNREEYERAFIRAIEAGKKRDYKKAASLLESLAIQGVAEKPEVLLYLARSYHALNQYALSVSSLNAYLSLREADADGWFFLGRSYLAMSSYSMAVSCLEKSLELNPDSATAMGLLGTAYFKSGKNSEALAVFKKALYLDPDDERLNQAYQNSLFVEAIKTYNAGNPDLALRMFDFCIANGMNAVLPHLYKAHCLREKGLLLEALSEYNTASALSPSDPTLHWYELSVLTMMGKTNEAKTLINSLQRQFPDFDFTLPSGDNKQLQSLNIIKNALLEENWKGAVEAGRMYVKVFGSDAVVHCFMGEACRNLGKYEDSLNHFSKARSLDAKYAAYRYGLLLTYLSMEDWQRLGAELHRKDALSLDAETVQYYAVICDAKTGKDPKKVLEQVQKVYLKNPGDMFIMEILASLYVKVGLPELAETWLKKLVAFDSRNENYYIMLIDCYEKLERKRDLDSAYKQYLQSWPSNTTMRKNYIRFLTIQKKWKAAADNIEMLIPYSSHQETLTRNLASFRRRAGEHQKSAVLYRSLLQQNPNDRHIMQRYVFCLVKLSMNTQALRFIQLWHKTYSLDADGALIEASLLLQLNEREKALDTLRSAFKLFSSDTRITKKIAKIYERMGILDMARQFDPSIGKK